MGDSALPKGDVTALAGRPKGDGDRSRHGRMPQDKPALPSRIGDGEEAVLRIRVGDTSIVLPP